MANRISELMSSITMFMVHPSKKPENHLQKKVKFYETWTFFIIICIFIQVVFKSFLYSPFHIPSGSMKPTLLIGDYIFVSKFSYGYSRYSLPFGINLIEGRKFFEEPKRGDVIVFRQPTNTSVDFIKRLVGLPGDRIQVRDGVLYINGEKIKRECQKELFDDDGIKIKQCIETLPEGRSYMTLDQNIQGALDNTQEYIVPPEHYFFMGDNRDNSMDSRVTSSVGFVPKINLVGRAEVIFFSFRQSIFKVSKWPSLFRKRFWVKIE